MTRTCILLLGGLLAASFCTAGELPTWVDCFSLKYPEAKLYAAPAPIHAELPSFECTAPQPGRELVRVSLPFAPGAFPIGMGIELKTGSEVITPKVRHLTAHPGMARSIRRAILTFVYDFKDTEPHHFELQASAPIKMKAPIISRQFEETIFEAMGYVIRFTRDAVEVSRDGQPAIRATILAPPISGKEQPRLEEVEITNPYLWMRLFQPDPQWPRIIEVRADEIGRIALRAHVQRGASEGGERAPELGWRIEGPSFTPLAKHEFSTGETATCSAGAVELQFPDAHLLKRGHLEATDTAVTYIRSTAEEQVPQQLAAWRTATVVIAPAGTRPLNSLLETDIAIQVDPRAYAPLYATAAAPDDLSPWPTLDKAMAYHLESMANSMMIGDDYGNVGAMPGGGTHSMNRLNHCPPLFHTAYEYGDRRLRDVGLLWCSNFYDLTIWWGTERPEEFGGTRYNNRAASDPNFPADPNFMWRSDTAVHFCTKGYDSFFYAWEETGDPRMAAALRWQTDYAARMVHTNQGECRNIGDVLDFIRLYEFTREPQYLENALRLFRELREKLSTGDLFSQGGEPLAARPAFIDMDKEGYADPYAKPYIIGYALAGLPALARYAPDEPKLREVIRAVADFLASTVDPAGGWRYPHPLSSRLLTGQAIEHAAQLVRAAQWLEAHGENVDGLLDAVEVVLQSRWLGLERTGSFFTNLDGWERSTGKVAPGESVKSLYAFPEDRDRSRDYTEGAASASGNSPEGVVYFPEVLRWYLKHRPAERLHNATPQLAQVLDRLGPAPAPSAQAPFPGHGIIQDNLVTFHDAQKARLTYPLAWNAEKYPDFTAWREEARAKVHECLLTPPPRADFAPEVVAVEDRGTYEARKVLLNISSFCRIPAYLLVPKLEGPLPAVITLHDHGAHFSIGKEKVVRPFGVSEEVMADATDWTNKYYGARWIGDELAKQGYVVFAIDALFWGERGRLEGVDYEAQQAVSANLLQLGMTWPGVINWDDVRSADFVASLPQVDPRRIGCMGLSMGSHRTWMLCANTDRVAAGVAICWMGTTGSLMVPGNNQTTGQSAYSMLAPDLRNWLDYPDVAAIACPKPMLFFNGTKDALFPVPGVEDAYTKMHAIWDAQGAGDKLYTKLWDVPHEYNAAMQDDAFAWLAKQLKK